jgi:hypothetical protein
VNNYGTRAIYVGVVNLNIVWRFTDAVHPLLSQEQRLLTLGAGHSTLDIIVLLIGAAFLL